MFRRLLTAALASLLLAAPVLAAPPTTDAEAMARLREFFAYVAATPAPPAVIPPVVTPPIVTPPTPPTKTQAEISTALAEAALPRVSISSVEVDPGQSFAYVPVRLLDASGKLQPPTTTVYVEVATQNGSGASYAYEGGQYSKVAKTLVFPAGGGAEQSVAIPVRGGPDGMWFALYTPNAANIGTVTAIATGRITFKKGAVNAAVAYAAPAPRAAQKGALTFDLDLKAFKASDKGGPGVAATNLPGNMRTQPGNGEIGFYTDPSLHPGTKSWELRDGVLVMRAEAFTPSRSFHPPHRADGIQETYAYGAASIRRQDVSQLYGYFEAEVQSASAPGTWGAFWLMPADNSWPPEIDIFEHWRNSGFGPGKTSATHHWGANNRQLGTNIDLRALFGDPALDLTAGYHKYAVDWRADFTTWYVDDREVWRSPTTFHKAAYPMFTVAVGAAGGTPDFSKGGTEMKVRALRVFK